jgi:geranyl-CoA carboxylase alpha subunit
MGSPTPSRFDSVLVANRGEIAVRILRTARAQGYRTIAVYSEADADALHVREADEAVLIGPAAVRDSYLDPERILDAARRTGAGAVHPGYGFLSENADFASACEAAGLVFIGPPAAAIAMMGNKAAAKRHMQAAGVPCIPGYEGEEQSDEALLEAAAAIGFPLMVKAAAGGGGRGMRRVDAADALPEALAAARSEAVGAFGSDELILEKAIIEPRHVEVQVFSDRHGHHLHFGERDCSVQRRHQKVVEEAPCPVMDAALRARMGAAAVEAARSIDYCGAGTVEFLLDVSGEFYFLEMNTRLQVEHPVTEMVTGVDLVALQLQVAQGYPLPCAQEDIHLLGHAIEVRLYAEDCPAGFLPATGDVAVWQPPAGECIRVDHGLAAGQRVSPFYDPMLAKIIAWGEDREIARRRLRRALARTALLGVRSNRGFLLQVLDEPAFIAGEATTALIGQMQVAAGAQTGVPAAVPSPAAQAAALCAAAVLQYRQARAAAAAAGAACAAPLLGWTGTRDVSAHFEYELDDESPATLYVRQSADAAYELELNGEVHRLAWLAEPAPGSARVLLDRVQCELSFAFIAPGEVSLLLGGQEYVLRNRLAVLDGRDERSGSGAVLAPLHGQLLRLSVSAGDRVAAGDLLCTLEAMKMEHRLCAEVTGCVSAVHAAEGEQVAAGALLLEITPQT